MLHIYTQPFNGRDNNSNIHRPRSSDAKIDWQRVLYMYTTHIDAWLVITMTISVFCRLGVIRLHRMHNTGCALLLQSSVVCLWVWVYVCLYICWSLGCSGKFWFGGTVSERSQQRGNLRPRARRVVVLEVSAGGDRPLLLRGSGGVTPENFFWRFLMPNPAICGNLGQKINWSRVNLTSTTWFAGTLRSAVPAPKLCMHIDICTHIYSHMHKYADYIK